MPFEYTHFTQSDNRKDLRMSPKLADVCLAIEGCEPVYLGELDFETANALALEMERIGIAAYVDDSLESSYSRSFRDHPLRRLRANDKSEDLRAEFERLDKSTLVLGAIEMMEKQFVNPKLRLLRETCTVGRHLGQNIDYPISYRDVEDISLEEAAINLAPLFGNLVAASKQGKGYHFNQIHMPQSVYDEFVSHKYVSQRFLDQLDEDDRASVKKLVSKVVDQFFGTNAKLSKSYIPSEMGIGEPSEFEGYNKAPTQGSVGLNLTNARSLVSGEDITGLRSARDVVTGLLKQARRSRAKTRKSFNQRISTTFETILETLEGFGPAATSCTQASKGCYGNCLIVTGQRGNPKNPWGNSSRIDEGISRMKSTYLHCAFLANPYYFLRVLIHAVYVHTANHMSQVCSHNAKALVDPSLMFIDDIEEYTKKLPPSIRLNVYSDYVWEQIYPDLFSLFDLENPERFGNRGEYPRASAMFYDYTKVPARWSTAQRRKLFKSVGMRWSRKYEYNLPSNYHLTFSFSGEKNSFFWSQICSLAGQNSTYVFSTTSIMNDSVMKALKRTKQVFGDMGGRDVAKRFEEINTKLIQLLGDAFRMRFDDVETYELKNKGATHIKPYVGPLGLLPATYGFIETPVISGDVYDLRFLDVYKQKGDNAVIVGLAWKVPLNVKLEINGKTSNLEPAICALYLKDDENVVNVEQGIGFGIPRYLLGQNVRFRAGDVSKVFSLYVVAKSTDQVSANDAISAITQINEEDLANFAIGVATETGSSINFDIGTHTVQALMTEAVNESLQPYKEK